MAKGRHGSDWFTKLLCESGYKVSVPLDASVSVESVVTRKSNTIRNFPCTLLQYPVVLTSLKASLVSTTVSTLKGATSQVAGSPAVLDRTVIVLDRTVIVLDRNIIVLDRSVIAIYGIFSLNFLRLGGGSDHLWFLRAVRHTSAPALPTLSILSGDRYVNKTLPRAGLFPGGRSCDRLESGGPGYKSIFAV